MPKLNNAQLDVIRGAARKGGLLVTDVVDGRVVEEVRWHKYVRFTEREDGSILLVATDAGRAAIAAAKKAGSREGADGQPAEPPAQSSVARRDPKGKLGALVALLRRPGGATIVELTAATGWQARSVRGAMSGALKKRHGLTIVSEESAEGRLYGIPADDVP